MRILLVPLSLLLINSLCLTTPLCLAATPAAPPATAPAAPATLPARDPKAAMQEYTQAMLDGDLKRSMDLMVFPSEEVRKIIGDELAMRMANVQYVKACDAAFADAGKRSSEASQSDSFIKDMQKVDGQLPAATVQIHGTTAEIAFGESRSIWFELSDGAWKLDLVKTRGRGNPTADRNQPYAAQAAAYKDTLADVQNKKFQTVDQADAALAARLVAANGIDRADQARRKAAFVSIATLRTGIESFEIDNDRYPSTAEGLDALVHKPAGPRLDHWKRYMEEVPLDPWGRPFVYRFPAPEDATDYEIRSLGPDGKEGTPDDITQYTKP